MKTFTLKLLLSSSISSLSSVEQCKLVYKAKGCGELDASEINSVNLLTEADSEICSGKVKHFGGDRGCKVLHIEINYDEFPVNATPEMLNELIYYTEELTFVGSDGNKIIHDCIFMNEVNLTEVKDRPSFRSERDKAIVNLQIEVNKQSDVTFTFSQVEHYIGSDMSVGEINEWYYDTKHGEGVTQDDIIDLCVDL